MKLLLILYSKKISMIKVLYFFEYADSLKKDQNQLFNQLNKSTGEMLEPLFWYNYLWISHCAILHWAMILYNSGYVIKGHVYVPGCARYLWCTVFWLAWCNIQKFEILRLSVHIKSFLITTLITVYC